MIKSYKKLFFAFIIFTIFVVMKSWPNTIDTKERGIKKIIFIAHTESIGGKGIYEIYKEMKHLKLDVKIALIPLFYSDKKLSEQIDFKFAKLFDEKDVIFPCGMSEPYKCKGLDDLKPDYIFTQMPYDPYSGSPLNPYFTNNYLKKISKKMVQIVYGPHIFHQLGMNNKNLSKLVDLIFVDSEVSKEIYVKYFGFDKNNVVVSGYQPYKDIRDKINNKAIEKNHQETILWLPRWQLSFKDRELYEGGSTFLNYHYFLYNFLKQNPEIHLIVRPHFGLFLLRDKFLTQEELMSILDKFKTLPNATVSLHQDNSLTEDIMKSDIIISDGSSALAEVIVANKPIIYLSNGTNNEFNSNELSKYLKKEIFLAYDPVDIEKYLEIIRKNNYQTNYDKNFKKMLDPVENPAHYIAKYVSEY